MKTRIFLAAGAAIMLGSCAEAPKMEMARPASCTGICKVEVVVAAGCKIQPVDPVYVAKGTHVVQWSLNQGSLKRYAFAPKGIEFNDSSAPFKDPKSGPVVFTWVDHNDGNASGSEKMWKYTITLLDNGVPCLDPLDPYVINDP